MKLSILDQAPIFPGHTASQALQATIELAKLAEEWGYTRYWMAEHHGLENIACSNPETMLGFLGAITSNIRLGSGAVLLPHYRSYKIAETYNQLAVLCPGRIDIGIGRGPGGSAETVIALSGNFLENVKAFPEKVTELLHFLRRDFTENNIFAKINPNPIPRFSPLPWMLGTSEKSAQLAAKMGTGYVFGEFMSENDGEAAIRNYRTHFEPGPEFSSPYTILTVQVVCAPLQEEANDITYSVLHKQLVEEKRSLKQNPILNEEDKRKLRNKIEKVIAGTPEMVKRKLEKLHAAYQADEIMVITYTNDYQQRKDSYRLLSESILQIK